MNIVRRDQFLGANNIAKPERLPEGAVADAVNFDFTVGGKAELRTGFQKVRQGDMRALFSLGDEAVIVDGNDIITLSGDGEKTVAWISDGPVAGVEHAGKLYIRTLNEALEVDREGARSWTVDAPWFHVGADSGMLEAGIYKVAVTRAESGKESGAIPATIRIEQGGGILLACEAGTGLRLYCSQPNGETLYYQGEPNAGGITSIKSRPESGTARLETAMLASFPYCSILESHNGMVVGSRGSRLTYSRPFMPHLYKPEADYIQMPADITLIADVGTGLFVCSDKTYFITGIGGPEMSQMVSLDFGAVRGSKVRLPDGSAAWFTKYGQAIASREGSVQLMNRASYSPEIAVDGAAGLIERNGNQLVVTTMHGLEQGGSCLRSTDNWNLEVVQ